MFSSIQKLPSNDNGINIFSTNKLLKDFNHFEIELANNFVTRTKNICNIQNKLLYYGHNMAVFKKYYKTCYIENLFILNKLTDTLTWNENIIDTIYSFTNNEFYEWKYALYKGLYDFIDTYNNKMGLSDIESIMSTITDITDIENNDYDKEPDIISFFANFIGISLIDIYDDRIVFENITHMSNINRFVLSVLSNNYILFIIETYNSQCSTDLHDIYKIDCDLDTHYCEYFFENEKDILCEIENLKI